MSSPDRFSIITYVSQFYYKFYTPSEDQEITTWYNSFSSSDGNISFKKSGRAASQTRGAVLSLMDGRRTRSMSTLTSQRYCPASPLIENENPFRGLSSETVAHYEMEVLKSQRRKERPKSEIQKRPQRKLGRRLTQSMLIESSSDIEFIPVKRTVGKPRHVLSNSSYAIPYKCRVLRILHF